MPPSKHKAGRTGILIRIPDELYMKFKKLANITGSSMNDILLKDIIEITKNITLTSNDYTLYNKKHQK